MTLSLCFFSSLTSLQTVRFAYSSSGSKSNCLSLPSQTGLLRHYSKLPPWWWEFYFFFRRPRELYFFLPVPAELLFFPSEIHFSWRSTEEIPISWTTNIPEGMLLISFRRYRISWRGLFFLGISVFPEGNPAIPQTTIDFIPFPFFRNFASPFRIFLFFSNDSPLPSGEWKFLQKKQSLQKT